MSLPSKRPLVYFITDGTNRNTLSNIEAAAHAGVDLIQIREKHLTAREVFDLTSKAVKASRGRAKVLVNDRFDIALAAKADGVHLTSTSMSASIVRHLVPDNFLIGVSTHTLEEVSAAEAAGADFALFGPIFDSPGKSAIGSELLYKATRAELPVIAIGGIDADNFDQVLNAGAAGFAAIRALNDAASLARIMESLR